MITRIVKMRFTREGISKFQEVFASASSKIAGFPGCHHLELVQGEDEQIFFTLSRWENSEALEAYRHSELFKNTWAKTKIHFDAKPEAWSTFSKFSSTLPN